MSKPPTSVKTAAIQQACNQDKADNLAHSLQQIRRAAAAGAELVVLPELHCSHYFCVTQNTDNFDLAEPIPGPSSTVLADCAKELGIVLVASLFEQRGKGLYHNTAVVFERDGSIAGHYRKMHIPDDPGYNEKFYFTPGDADGKTAAFEPITTSVGKLGILVCWDQWFPEAARLMSLAGADILIYPTAIGWDPQDTPAEQARQLDAWLTIQRAHAIANGLPLVSCNRIGHEPDPSGRTEGSDFWGHSFICGPQGEFLQQSQQNAAIISHNIDLQASERVRRIWPYLRDRRVDAYSGLVQRYLD